MFGVSVLIVGHGVILLEILRLLDSEYMFCISVGSLAVTCSAFGCCVENSKLHSSGDLCSGAMLGSTVDTYSASVRDAFGRILHIFFGEVDSNPVASSPFSRRVGKCAQQISLLSCSRCDNISSIFTWLAALTKVRILGGTCVCEVHGQVPEELPPSQAAGTEYFSLDVEDMPAAGMQPGVLAEPRPQERVQRHTMEHIVDLVRVAPMVQVLDAPVPQMVDQLPDVVRFFDLLLPVPEQVIEVPKILLDDVPMRTAVRDTQLAEQLVEVPTIVSWSLLQLIAKQNVDMPVPGRGGGISSLQGFLPRQSSTGLDGSLERISERIVEQNVDFPVGGGPQEDFLPGQSSSASSSSPAGVHGSADGPGEGFFFFALFPKFKKCEVGFALTVGTAPRVEPIHPGSSCGRVLGGGASGQVPAAL